MLATVREGRAIFDGFDAWFFDTVQIETDAYPPPVGRKVQVSAFPLSLEMYRC